ncbi:hypothetical protein B5P46_12375 [Rhizobium leguminosarum]|uniref:Uncharacterized protein n=1 Tax=Rhizobium leguminosarum TaxID=384 RepID=A0A4Q1U7G3_RHILE|nr:hypothetical protein B5P46_12375 [Rhizobium leguminosarum]
MIGGISQGAQIRGLASAEPLANSFYRARLPPPAKLAKRRRNLGPLGPGLLERFQKLAIRFFGPSGLPQSFRDAGSGFPLSRRQSW